MINNKSLIISIITLIVSTIIFNFLWIQLVNKIIKHDNNSMLIIFIGSVILTSVLNLLVFKDKKNVCISLSLIVIIIFIFFLIIYVYNKIIVSENTNGIRILPDEFIFIFPIILIPHLLFTWFLYLVFLKK